jgi:hypothetical protein
VRGGHRGSACSGSESWRRRRERWGCREYRREIFALDAQRFGRGEEKERERERGGCVRERET